VIDGKKSASLALVLALLAASACHRNDDKQPAPSSAPSAPAKPLLSDASITAAVDKVLAHDPGVDRSNIHVATTDGIVELTGSARNLLTKKRAARVVEAVRGVRAVSDRTTLNIDPRPDQQILQDLKNALVMNAAADSYEVNERVHAGKVTLTGSVQSYQEREMAGRLAEGVLGVREVDNQVLVKHGASRSDAEVAADITSRLRWDALVNDGMIDVAVHGGTVFLSGKVASAAEKRRATVDAWVLGTANVDDKALKVDALAEERDYLKHKLFIRSDADVAKAIQTAAAYDPRVSAANLRVSVDHGKARLEGHVGSVAARFAVEDLARHTVGVMDVQNELSVEFAKHHSDAEVVRAVEAALLSDPYTYSQSIVVKASAGKVTLTGKVRSHFERAEATDLAAGIEGVKDVDNDLHVERDDVAYIFDTYLVPYGPLWGTWYAVPGATTRSDSDIARAIHDEFVWNPWVDAEDVKVQVKGGHATLTGQVTSQGERIAATEDAYEGGAVAVDNRLTLASGG
jgi:osmotically-inducible protein OsmY